MSAKRARFEQLADELGYDVVEGAYEGTSDDRIGRYYLQSRSSTVVDRTGPGLDLNLPDDDPNWDERIAELEDIKWANGLG